jgi:quercetin dioxygenase-like cupin family protein
VPIEPSWGIHANTSPVEVAGGILRRPLVWGERMMLLEFRVPKGTGIPRHDHPHEQLGYVVSGRMEFTIGDQTRVLGPGDTYLMPSNVPHHTRALEDSVVVDVFAPVREDYIPKG